MLMEYIMRYPGAYLREAVDYITSILMLQFPFIVRITVNSDRS